jgi:hypothetical protein
MGYYPFGSKRFSDLTHYVRSGDFVVNLLREAGTLNEYAFALGALAHYSGDTNGHPVGVNPAVGIEYPKLARRFGPLVNYEDKPSAHIRVEFAFDVLQVARGRYAPKSFHDFIGFEVATEQLQRAFRATYSLELSDLFANLDLALGSYRRAVSSVIPSMTRAAWAMKKDELIKAQPGLSRAQFVYSLSRAEYRKEWKEAYREPGIRARMLAFLLRIVPKIGPFKPLAFKAPSSDAVALFDESIRRTVTAYENYIADAAAGRLRLPNRNLDTGLPARPAAYRMADDTYADLAEALAKLSAAPDPAIRDEVLAWFADPNLPFARKKHHSDWRKTQDAIAKLRETTAAGTIR